MHYYILINDTSSNKGHATFKYFNSIRNCFNHFLYFGVYKKPKKLLFNPFKARKATIPTYQNETTAKTNIITKKLGKTFRRFCEKLSKKMPNFTFPGVTHIS